MAEDSYDNISVLVFDPDLTSRKGTAYALNNLGIREIDEHHNLKDLREVINSKLFDLVFLECSDELTETFPMVEDIRRNKLGGNPFVSIMFTLWQPTEAVVLRALRTGADDIIIKPFSANTVNDRVQFQIARRKPFVFNEDYLGPVRKVGRDELRMMAPVEVPNFLRAKARSEPLPTITQSFVDSIFNFQRCKEQQARIDEAVGGLKTYFDNPEIGDFPIGLVTNLISASSNLAETAKAGGFLHIVELCRAVNDVAANVQGTGVSTEVKDLSLMENTAAAIGAGLRDRESAIEAAHEIAQTVRNIGGRT